MMNPEIQNLQNAINEFFAWLLIQQENLEVTGEADLASLETRLQGIIGLLNPHTAIPSIKEEFEKLQRALNDFGHKVELKRLELQKSLQQTNQQTQGIARYLQTAK
jgi:hypothetical protein